MNKEQDMDKIFTANRAWADRVRAEDPEFLRQAGQAASAGIPVDRLLGFTRAGQ